MTLVGQVPAVHIKTEAIKFVAANLAYRHRLAYEVICIIVENPQENSSVKELKMPIDLASIHHKKNEILMMGILCLSNENCVTLNM